MRSIWLFGLAAALSIRPGAAAALSPNECSGWTLDGYHLGMRGDELLAVRSLTLHVEGQAQAVEPGRFHGVIVLDALNRLKKWDVAYETHDGTALRADLQGRFGEPSADISGNLAENDPGAGRQRRTIWWNQACDVAIIVYEHGNAGDTGGRTVSATLTRASSLPHGLVQMKTLFH